MEMDILEFIKSRRSTRLFLPTAVEREKLDMIIESGRYAPSGGNNQNTHLIVIENREILENLSQIVNQRLREMKITEDTYPPKARAIRAARSNGYSFHYHSPALILLANKIGYDNNIADCACVMENMMLMANALDLGSCWINHLRWESGDETLLPALLALGMKEDERIFASLAIGYADSANGLPERTPLPRKGNPVTWIK